ncbi:cell division protein FtsQ [Pasteurellaceae bacterium Macca]|nr:cell division protein FtsQ [Pasteurellaceae bacterium Macca]
MFSLFRRRPQSVIFTTASKPNTSMNWRVFIKPTIVLLCALFLYGVYSQWANILSKLDSRPIRAYALTHKTRFTHQEDIRAILVKEPVLQGYFSQDVDEIKGKFLELPWIKEVIVRKIYPDKLNLTLIEHRPMARWNNSKYVSDQGVVFELPEGRLDNVDLPILYGPDSEGKTVLNAWTKIKQDLQARHLGLYSVAMDIRGSWSIRLDNGVELRLGRGDWLPKIDRFVAIFPEIDVPKGKRLAYVDLRYEHGASVGFRNQ